MTLFYCQEDVKYFGTITLCRKSSQFLHVIQFLWPLSWSDLHQIGFGSKTYEYLMFKRGDFENYKIT